LRERLTSSHRKKYKCLETWNQASETSTLWKTTTGKEYGSCIRYVECDAVKEDAKKLMGVRNWKRAAQEREERRGLIMVAKARYRAVAP
jgi:hypothetical protein